MLTEQEKKQLNELIAKKKKEKLSDADFAVYKDLMKKSKTKGKANGNGKKSSSFDPGNDPAWWMKQPELVRDSASFKSNYVAGRMIDPVRVPYVVPGVLQIELRTCYHAGCTPTDAINVWARNLFLKMFQKYRPVTSYSASDLGIAILAALEAVKLIATYERIYGVINRYSLLNINMPAVEAEALGLSPSELTYLQGHMSDFRYDLNFLLRKAQRLCIPKDISLIADAISLLGYEYIDHNNPRGQIIVFTLRNYGVYSDTAISTGGSIGFKDPLIADLFNFTADNMCKALVDVLDALLGSDSIQRIFADLVVWFGGDAMLQFLPVPEDYVVVPVESASILHKMHNMEQEPSPLDSGNYPTTNTLLTSWAHGNLSSADQGAVLNGYYHVYQYNDAIVTVGCVKDTNTGTPVSQPFNGVAGRVLEGTSAVRGMGTAHVIDGYNVDVTPEFVIEGSLFKYVSAPSSNDLAAMITSNVNWLVHNVVLHTNGTIPANIPLWRYQASDLNAAYLSLIDWAPLCYQITQVGGDTNILEILGDVDVIIPVSAGDLNRIHRTCFMSGITTEVPIIKN